MVLLMAFSANSSRGTVWYPSSSLVLGMSNKLVYVLCINWCVQVNMNVRLCTGVSLCIHTYVCVCICVHTYIYAWGIACCPSSPSMLRMLTAPACACMCPHIYACIWRRGACSISNKLYIYGQVAAHFGRSFFLWRWFLGTHTSHPHIYIDTCMYTKKTWAHWDWAGGFCAPVAMVIEAGGFRPPGAVVIGGSHMISFTILWHSFGPGWAEELGEASLSLLLIILYARPLTFRMLFWLGLLVELFCFTLSFVVMCTLMPSGRWRDAEVSTSGQRLPAFVWYACIRLRRCLPALTFFVCSRVIDEVGASKHTYEHT